MTHSQQLNIIGKLLTYLVVFTLGATLFSKCNSCEGKIDLANNDLFKIDSLRKISDSITFSKENNIALLEDSIKQINNKILSLSTAKSNIFKKYNEDKKIVLQDTNKHVQAFVKDCDSLNFLNDSIINSQHIKMSILRQEINESKEINEAKDVKLNLSKEENNIVKDELNKTKKELRKEKRKTILVGVAGIAVAVATIYFSIK